MKPETALRKAFANLKTGAIEEAHTIFSEILSRFPENKRAKEGLKLAKAAYEPPGQLIAAIQKMHEEADYQSALKQCIQLLQEFPNSAALRNLCGSSMMFLNDFGSAALEFKKAIDLKPDFYQCYNNLGNALSAIGKLESSIEAYHGAIKHSPQYALAHFNLGVLFKQNADLKEAAGHFYNAVRIDPTWADAQMALGVTLGELGDPGRAADCFKRAMNLSPISEQVIINLGAAQAALGEHKAALETLLQGLELNPHSVAINDGLGRCLLELKHPERALDCFQTVLASDSNNDEALRNFGVALQRCHYDCESASGPILMDEFRQRLIYRLITNAEQFSPIVFAKPVMAILKKQNRIRELLEVGTRPLDLFALKTCVEAINDTPLIAELMTASILPDAQFERLFRELRREISSNLPFVSNEPAVIEFLKKLAIQSFINEYVYSENQTETLLVDKLAAEVGNDVLSGRDPKLSKLLCLSCYRPLHRFDWSDRLRFPEEASLQQRVLLDEPRREYELKKSILLHSRINSAVSKEVRQQYEDNPYPRWVRTGLPSSQDWLGTHGAYEHALSRKSRGQGLRILIAGSGTGVQPIRAAVALPDAQVLAVDLSLSSLAYSKRKSEELGIHNIDYLQGDILDLGSLKDDFDIIECVGVLHHLKDPILGWRVLLKRLSPGGFMKIGLYSEIARSIIVRLREEIKQRRLGVSASEMKTFREELFSSKDPSIVQLCRTSDLYSLSMVRDLLFHSMEHRFSIPEIEACLKELELEFCGFIKPGCEEGLDLSAWHDYEEDNPSTFAEMYQFWCRKPA